MWTRLASHLIKNLQTLLQNEAKEKFVIRFLETRSKITVVGCINAAGQAIPLFVARCLHHDWTDGEVPGTT